MDVVISSGRDETIRPEPPSALIEISKDESEMKSSIFMLPTEITMLIFQQCESDILSRLTLTHTCLRWRQIAVNSASLWTKISIQTRIIKGNSRLDPSLSLLGMQLDRTAHLLLDVYWTARVGDELFAATLQLLREKAPFSRWRSLDMIGGSNDDDPWSGAPWSAADAFTNLEFLYVWNGLDNTIVSVINRTVTSRLKTLHVACSSPSAEKIATSFAKALTHITSLRLRSLFPYPYQPFLPANVVNFELAITQQHIFPHIQTYTLKQCIFTGRNTVDLRNLTTLIVRRAMACFDCHVLLPALQKLMLGGLSMSAGAKIETPVLDMLYFMTPADVSIAEASALFSATDQSLREGGYLLSPNTSINVDSYLPSLAVINLLTKSPKVTRVTLCFYNWTGAQAVLESLVVFEGESLPPSVENVHLCPRLSELRLDFGWEPSEPSTSKEWLMEMLKSRREASFTAPLSIYATWKGGEVYALHTDN